MNLTSIFTYIITQISVMLSGLEDEEKQEKKGGVVSYENAQVWQTDLRSKDDIKMFQELSGDGAISLWRLTNNQADYLVFAEKRELIDRELHKRKLNHTIFITDVQRKIDDTKIKPTNWTKLAVRNGHRILYDHYPSIEVLNEFFEHVKNQHTSIASVKIIGSSVEGRPIKMVKISNGNSENKAILLTGGHHAREWVSITSPIYIIDELVSTFNEQPKEYWDMRSNLNYPCSEDYVGSSALSEPEAKALNGVLESLNRKNLSAFVDFHSYGQMILHPWSCRIERSPHSDILKSTAEEIKKEIDKTTGRSYKIGSAPELLYQASGTAIDHFHSKGAILSYAIEGRDTVESRHGFLLPADQIKDAAIEMLEAVKIVAHRIE